MIRMWSCGDLVIDSKFLDLVIRMSVAYRRAVHCKSKGHPLGAEYLLESRNLGWIAGLLAAGVESQKYVDKYADN